MEECFPHQPSPAAAPTLTTLPEDPLSVLLSHLDLPADGGALRAVSTFFSSGAGSAALSQACQLVCAQTLGCAPADVVRVVGPVGPSGRCHRNDDWLRTAAFVVWSHTPLSSVACTNHVLMVASGRVVACGSNDAGQLGNGKVSQFSATIYTPSPTFSVDQYLARQQRNVEQVGGPTTLCTGSASGTAPSQPHAPSPRLGRPTRACRWWWPGCLPRRSA